MIVVVWYVLNLTDSPFLVGLTASARMGFNFLALFAGATADLVPRRTLMIIIQAVLAFLALVMLVLIVSGQIEVWHIFIPDSMPLFVRVSATEYMENGWDVDECVDFSRWLKEDGVDLIDCSSGGNSSTQTLTPFPGYQVQFSACIRSEAEVTTGAVGLITDAVQAEKILDDGEADVILLARELLRNPYWPIQAQTELDGSATWPDQYKRVAELRNYPAPPR